MILSNIPKVAKQASALAAIAAVLAGAGSLVFATKNDVAGVKADVANAKQEAAIAERDRAVLNASMQVTLNQVVDEVRSVRVEQKETQAEIVKLRLNMARYLRKAE